jgi:parvulin-like peptidyl-prolyl isomerase
MFNRMSRLFYSTLLLALALPIAGCMDESGSRVTMGQWWDARHGAKAKDDPTLQSAHQERAAELAQDSSRSDDTPSAARATPARPARPTPQPKAETEAVPSHMAIRSDSLLVDEETIKVADILEPISIRIEEWSRQFGPDEYYVKVARVVRQQIVEAVAQHLIWRRAKLMIREEMEPQIKKAVEKMEKDRINREFGGRETLYEKYLTRHGKNREGVRDDLRRAVIIDSYLRDQILPLVPAPRKKELQRYYESHRAEYSPPSRREMLLIESPVEAYFNRKAPYSQALEQAAKVEARRVMEEAQAALKAGQKFEEVARKYSKGPHGDEGGSWGMISAPTSRDQSPLQGRWSAPSMRLFELAPDQTSDIIESGNSFFIVKPGKIEAGKVVTFQEAQPEIVNAIKQERFVKLRAEFLQGELEKSTLGSLEEFVNQVMRAVPSPTAASLTNRPAEK